MGKAHPNNLQYPIDLGGTSDVGDILGQLPEQTVDFNFENTKSGSIDKNNNHPLEIHRYKSPFLRLFSVCNTHVARDHPGARLLSFAGLITPL